MTTVSDTTQEMVTEVYLSSDLIDISETNIRIFALDSFTIGLSNVPPKLWIDQCLWESKASVLKEEEEFTIILPDEVVRFYRPKKIEIAGSPEKDNILLVISSSSE